jgi:thiol-disulfide isomerase/thioredoxin
MFQQITSGLVAIMIALLASCASKNDELQPGRTVIAGRVVNMVENSTVLLVNFCNPLSEEYRRACDLTRSAGAFHVTHDYVFAQNLTIRYDNSFINFYIAPGDSVYLTIDGEKLQRNQDDAVIFSGSRARVNEQLSRWTAYTYKLPLPNLNPAASPADYLQGIKQSLDAIRDTIEAYARREGMDEFVKRWAFIDYKFALANQMLDYEDRASRWSVFTDPIFDVYNEENFQSMYFQYHANACINALARGNSEIAGQLELEDYIPALRAVINELSGKAPAGSARDMMLYALARNMINKRPEVYDAVPELKSCFSRPVFGKQLEALARAKMAAARKPAPLPAKTMKGISYLDGDSIVALPDTDILACLTERHENKVLYIDIWATWCGPCLAEMKHAPLLHERFAGKVVFVNLCLDSTVEDWWQAVHHDAIPGENYHLDKNATNIFMGLYNISGFPTYLLVDRDGQLHSPVARPSATLAAIKQIESYL